MIRKSNSGQQIATALRNQILSGRWAPGTKLPNRDVLAKELDSCLATLQLAIRQLAKEGFLTVGPRKFGTLVAPLPPHLCHYLVIFPHEPDDWRQFWRSIKIAIAQKSTPERQFSYFHSCWGNRHIADYRKVIKEVEEGRVAGLIFTSSAEECYNTPLIDHPGVPRVMIAQESVSPGVPKIVTDSVEFIDRSLDFLLAKGRSRIALLSSDTGFTAGLFCKAMAKRGLRTPAMWQQFSSLNRQENAAHVMELMFHSNQRERPDGLIIADDNFLTSATQGIANVGIRTPRDLTVVAMTNFPNILPTHVPVTRLGFDITELVDKLVGMLDALISGQHPKDHSYQPAVFEHELGKNAGA